MPVFSQRVPLSDRNSPANARLDTHARTRQPLRYKNDTSPREFRSASIKLRRDCYTSYAARRPAPRAHLRLRKTSVNGAKQTDVLTERRKLAEAINISGILLQLRQLTGGRPRPRSNFIASAAPRARGRRGSASSRLNSRCRNNSGRHARTSFTRRRRRER